MKEEVLRIGDVKVFTHPVVMRCFGLCSCIGLFVKDRNTGVSGGAHIFLPDDIENPNATFSASVNTLLEKMKTHGSTLSGLRAKLTGGSNLLGKDLDIGALNIASVIGQLHKHGVFIAARDVGGCKSRSAQFDATTESLVIHSFETKQTITI